MRLLIPILALVVGACGSAEDTGHTVDANDGCDATVEQRPVVKYYVWSKA